MKKVKFILTILAIIMLFGQSVACTCMEKPTVNDAIARQDVVLVGVIIASEEIWIPDSMINNRLTYRTEIKNVMIVESVFKGKNLTDTTYIYTGSDGGDCGFNFRVGEKYIVYGSYETEAQYKGQELKGKKSALYTTMCTRTMIYDFGEVAEIEKFLSLNEKEYESLH